MNTPPGPGRKFQFASGRPSRLDAATKGKKVRVVRNAKGRLMERCELHDGQLHGTKRLWSPSGQILVEDRYRHGQRHGLQRSWNRQGRLMSKCYYADGLRHGPHQYWWDNGKPKEIGHYEHDRRVGLYRWYDTNGKLIKRFQYAAPKDSVHKAAHPYGSPFRRLLDTLTNLFR